ncbi:SCO family protein [Desmospora profundinema]|uniref:Protein SCO1/2 n=1 Tax=Desmospora profundinema TaxID=1571184 RepID=A0ABU1INK0_9BACL|nr:SCO family protein [Desmospora profundinema]MDR6225978.1 protein SCO1/2 [Desmospora profundinema]
MQGGRQWSIWVALAVAVIVVGSWWWLDDSPQPVTRTTDPAGINSEPIPEFSYTNQDGEEFGFSDLEGEIWIANLVFTRCPDVCSPMTANLSRVQERLKEEGIDVELVTFSVDPVHDRPEVLKQFGSNLRADFSNWNFLTHDDPEVMHRFLQSAFRAPIKASPATDTEPLTIDHSTRFYVMDPSGRIMMTHDGLQPDMDAIVRDVAALDAADGFVAKKR